MIYTSKYDKIVVVACVFKLLMCTQYNEYIRQKAQKTSFTMDLKTK